MVNKELWCGVVMDRVIPSGCFFCARQIGCLPYRGQTSPVCTQVSVSVSIVNTHKKLGAIDLQLLQGPDNYLFACY